MKKQSELSYEIIEEHYGIKLTEKEKMLMHVYNEIVKLMEKFEQGERV